jgi:hypothetical protein
MAAPDGTVLSARELEARAREWQPWRGYAVVHLWGAAAERAALRIHAGNRPLGASAGVTFSRADVRR